jgi:hypothetical protein
MMKHHSKLLIAFLWLVACSPFFGSDRDQPALTFQRGNDLSSAASNSPTSPEDQDTASACSIFGKRADGLVTIFGESQTGNQSSIVTNPEVPVAPGSTTLLQEIQDLVAQRQVDLVPAVPGWLHLIIRLTSSKTDPLSAWDISSGQIQQEVWLLLDNQGLVRADIRRTLHTLEPAGGFTLGESGEWINLNLAANNTARSTLPFDPNYGIYELLAHLVRQGQPLNKGTLYKDCWYQGEKYTITDGRIVHEVLFRPDYHALRWIKTWQVSSGVLTLVDSLEIALEERLPQPPAEILALVVPSAP